MIIRMHAYLYKFYNSFGNFLACIQDSVHTHPPLPNIRNAGYHPDNLKAKDSLSLFRTDSFHANFLRAPKQLPVPIGKSLF